MTTPARRQYLEIKARFPQAILWFRMGDFYEMFDEDARVAAEALQITLTSREFGKGERVPMCGIPYHAFESYLGKLIARGFKVAICEQLSEPGHGLVERAVVRVVTPGTLVEPNLLPARANNYLAAVVKGRENIGLAYVDVNSGDFAATELCGEGAAIALAAELHRLVPAECLIPAADHDLTLPPGGHLTRYEPWRFDAETARAALCRHFGVVSLEPYGCAALPLATGAAGAILAYLEQTNPSLLVLLASLRTYSTAAFMQLDGYTRRNLELVQSARSGSPRGSLLWVLDQTRTAMGGRLLRRFLNQPLLDLAELQRRHDAVAAFVNHEAMARAEIGRLLSDLPDLERLTGRVRQGIAGPREMLALGEALRRVPRLKSYLTSLTGEQASPGPGLLAGLSESLDPCIDVVELISRAIPDDVDARGAAGDAALPLHRLIGPGYSAELDELVESVADARAWIAGLEPRERERTGIRSLKVGYNRVFGYYVEISRAAVHQPLIPDGYSRRQTLVGAERYVTPELKEMEARLLSAEDRIGELERRLFADLLQQIAERTERLMATADALGQIDVLLSLAEVAIRYGWARPELDDGETIEILEGRHPVIEVVRTEASFIPNDCHLDTKDGQIVVLTGANASGKSTYLRQVADVVLLAQIGSFVPARAARIGLVDRIFTRIGAQDDLAAGASTFMVEMMETATILHQATSRSLVILDEVGRGTSTEDGLAIAQAVVEHIHHRLGARTLFATHFYELTRLADRLPRVRNFNVATVEVDGEVVFLYKVVSGGADRSYGIHVARLAGLPGIVTARAEELLQTVVGHQEKALHEAAPRQLVLPGFDPPPNGRSALAELLGLDLNLLTPIEAHRKLEELQRRAGR